MSDSVLVTGAAGFIGSQLSERLLAEGREVLGIDCLTDYYDPQIKRGNLSVCLKHPSFQFLEEDLMEADLPSLLDGCKRVFHLSAQAGVRASWGADFGIYLRENLAVTQRILESLKSFPNVRLVYASTSSVYGQVESLPMREEQRPRPFSPYGVTKLSAEQMVDLYRMNFGLQARALRLFTVYGPRQRPDMAFSRFFRAALREEEIPVYGDGKQTRDYTFVEDIVECFLRAAEYEGEHFVFNAGGGSRLPLLEVFEIMESLLGKPLRLRHEERKKGDVLDTLASTERIREELDFLPQVSLTEGLARQLEWTLETGDAV
ncbi:MAG: NAD-dependent epimerase/dehydratase family protein [Candidatus Krumholzibacteria bacterium]|nr:NAD-dependent epimerase/dehydratase family protein [Candidatus Krumholzibacteria bacterium]MDP6669257.1 NAD-dependent epimerase/dehydratase family protein [Candidatus Krumholzibacteria bacterium]MDP6796673.1 NAD-dependent epimerase/dehydratase family protein [Candidatus Krumholzibacteria bacterium]MDP7021642.1 NAD-dependent epimerase/dehydratase family protein [Candidatus Krumholzibacteria bacterium]